MGYPQVYQAKTEAIHNDHARSPTTIRRDSQNLAKNREFSKPKHSSTDDQGVFRTTSKVGDLPPSYYWYISYSRFFAPVMRGCSLWISSSSSSAYPLEVPYPQIKSDPYRSSHSPGGSASSQNNIELHQQMAQLQHQQYYTQTVQHNPHHVPIDGFPEIDSHLQELGRQHSVANRGHQLFTDTRLQHDGNGLDDCNDCLSTFEIPLGNPMPTSQEFHHVQHGAFHRQ